jgi:hypothetical protein
LFVHACSVSVSRESTAHLSKRRTHQLRDFQARAQHRRTSCAQTQESKDMGDAAEATVIWGLRGIDSRSLSR